MVRNGSFCIDATEVPVADYVSFLAANPDPSKQPQQCATNTDFTPGGMSWTYQQTRPTIPVGWVSWCDARAFCAWAGKRLCGRIGGGPLARAAVATTTGEWFTTCSNGGARRYPYGNSYVAGACTDQSSKADRSPVGSVATCEGGVAGVFDLSGNAFEWIDSCVGSGDGNCVAMGGSIFSTDAASLACDAALEQPLTTKGDGDVGFRCCS